VKHGAKMCKDITHNKGKSVRKAEQLRVVHPPLDLPPRQTYLQ
jgi:hypothetical protein